MIRFFNIIIRFLNNFILFSKRFWTMFMIFLLCLALFGVAYLGVY